jgi:HNH endonuclease
MSIDYLLRAGETREMLREQFMRQVIIDASGCWYWRGAREYYGDFRGRPAHRVSWELHQGPIDNGLYILHGCNIVIDGVREPAKGCVNPAHLRPGTPQENSLDVVRSRSLARRSPQKKREDSIEVGGTMKGWNAYRFQLLADHRGVDVQDLFSQFVTECMGGWVRRIAAEIPTARYKVTFGRAIGGRISAQAIDVETGLGCYATANSLGQARDLVRRELGASLGDLGLAAIADLDDEEAQTDDIRALLEADGTPLDDVPDLPEALR